MSLGVNSAFSIHARDRVSSTKMRDSVKADRRGRERGREERKGERETFVNTARLRLS